MKNPRALALVGAGVLVIIAVVVVLAIGGGKPGPAAAPTVAATAAATSAPESAVTNAATTTEAPAAPTVSTQETTTFTSPLTFSSPLQNHDVIATPTFELVETSGVVYGRVAAMPPTWLRATVWLAPFTPVSEDGQTGFYVLEPSVHPYTDMFANGYFQLHSITPGQYVVIIGPNPEEALPLKENGNTRVVEVKAGEVLDLGEVSVP
jgi:hypothetical protein